MHTIPEDFAQRMIEVYGAAGEAWLRQLPALLVECADRWTLTIDPPFALSYNYVAPAMRADGSAVVLKVGFPSRELMSELDALRLYDGRGICRLLDANRDRGALLLERITPGTPLADLDDDEQRTRIAAQVMRQLWCPAPPDHSFPTVATWAAGMGRLRARFNGTTGPLPTQLVEQAESLFGKLLGSMGAPVLLHGDLHHWNILAADRQPWLALDPKGLVGEREYEVGAMLRNPLPWLLAQPNPDQILARRIAILAEELGFDRMRLVGWGVAQAVLSAWWMIEDHGYGWEESIACAEYLAMLLD